MDIEHAILDIRHRLHGKRHRSNLSRIIGERRNSQMWDVDTYTSIRNKRQTPDSDGRLALLMTNYRDDCYLS